VTNVPTLAERNGDFSQSLFGVPIIPGTGVPFPGGSIPGAASIPSVAISRPFILCQIVQIGLRTSSRHQSSKTATIISTCASTTS